MCTDGDATSFIFFLHAMTVDLIMTYKFVSFDILLKALECDVILNIDNV